MLLCILDILKNFKNIFFKELANILVLNKYINYFIPLVEKKKLLYSLLYNLFLYEFLILREYLEDVL